MSLDGEEKIHCGLRVGFNLGQQSISVSDMDLNIFLKEAKVAYMMNQNGKRVSRYDYIVRQ